MLSNSRKVLFCFFTKAITKSNGADCTLFKDISFKIGLLEKVMIVTWAGNEGLKWTVVCWTENEFTEHTYSGGSGESCDLAGLQMAFMLFPK